jgi:flagellar basal body-associated protein FliL
LGNDPFVAAARAESAARNSIPSIPESSLLPASNLQTAPPTAFRPPIPSGVGALETKQDSEVRPNSSKTPLWILLGVVGVVLIGGMVILGQRLFAGTNETANKDEPLPNASASAIATTTTGAPIVQVTPGGVLSAASTEKSPEPKNPGSSAKTATNKAATPANEATAPTSTAPAAPTTAPVPAPSPTPRKNPLDIND